MKCEDNKHMIANIYGLCVFFKLSPDNNYIIYTKNAVLIDISFSIETIKKKLPWQKDTLASRGKWAGAQVHISLKVPNLFWINCVKQKENIYLQLIESPCIITIL